MPTLEKPIYLLFKRHDEYNIVTVENYLGAFDTSGAAIDAAGDEGEIIVRFDGERLGRYFVLGPQGWGPACRPCGGLNNVSLVAKPSLMSSMDRREYVFFCELCQVNRIGPGEKTPDAVFFSGEDEDFPADEDGDEAVGNA